MKSYQKNVSLTLTSLFVLTLVFFGGYNAGKKAVPEVPSILLENKELGKPISVDFASFWKAWNVINQKFVGTTASSSKPVTDQDKVYGAIQGLAASLNDPYTVFFPPVENEIFESDVRGNFEGVGMEIGLQDGVLTVIAPLKGTPAYNAGIKPGDKILKIDGQSTYNWTTEQSVTKIRGKGGTTVTFNILRTGTKDAFDISVVRAQIDIPTINTELRSDGIFVIELYSFSAQSPDLFRKALREFVESGSDKLILDLRGNPGGYLEAAIDMASWFLPPGTVVVKEDFGAKQEPTVFRSRGYDIFSENLKFVILIDGGSASASEILAGALNEQKVATLVGEKTFGKGSVQELVSITSDTSLKVTIARWLTPNGNTISLNGIEPEYKVKFTKEDAAKNIDPQKNKAVEILLNGTVK